MVLLPSVFCVHSWPLIFYMNALHCLPVGKNSHRAGEESLAAPLQLKVFLHLDEDFYRTLQMMSHVYLNLQPLAKRACHPPSEEQYKAAVGKMERAVEAVKLLLQKGSPPPWLAVKLETLHTAIATLRDGVR